MSQNNNNTNPDNTNTGKEEEPPKIRYVIDLNNPDAGNDEEDTFLTEEELQNGNFIYLDENDNDIMSDEDGEDIVEDNGEDIEDNGEDIDEEAVEDDNIEECAQLVLRAHNDSIYSVAIHPINHEFVITGGGDDNAYLWNLKTSPEDPLFKFEGHKDSITGTEFNFDGKLCATSSLDGTVKIWSAESGLHLATCEGPEQGLNWIRWHNKGNVVLSGSEDGSAWLWQANGTFMQVFTGHGGSVTCGSFSSLGKVVLTGSEDASMRVWDPKTGKSFFTFSGHGYHEGPITCLTTTPMSDAVVMTGSEDSTCKISNIETGKVLTTFNHAESVESVAFSRVEGFAATGSMDKTAKIWDLNTKSDRMSLPHGDGVIKVFWNNKSALSDLLLVTASTDKTVRVWDIRNPSNPLVSSKTGHSDVLLDMALSGDGTFVVTGSDDRTARVFSL